MKRSFALLILAVATSVGATPDGAGFTPLDRATARSLTARQSHQHPTVVALWASDCSYCKQNLRTLARLAKSQPRLRIITVAAETPSADTRPELDKTGVPGPRYIYGDDVPEALAYALDPNWRGELPRTYLFDGRGNMQATSGVIDAAAFRAALKLQN